jgi:hypothetical protein
MGRKWLAVTVGVAAFVAVGSGAFAASRYLITSTKQIKPSVLAKIETQLFWQRRTGPLSTMCPLGSDTTGQCEIGSSDARCSDGGFATGGGIDGGSNPPVSATIGYDDVDKDGRGWHVVVASDDASGSASFQAVADCQLVTGGFAAGNAQAPKAVRDQIAREVTSMRAAAAEQTGH